MSRYTRWMAVGDTHGDMADADTLAAVRFLQREFKPTVRVAIGDHFDLRALRKGCSKDEEFEALDPDIEAGKAFLRSFAPSHWLRGNHDERLWDASKSPNPILARFACKAIGEVLECVPGVKMLPYDKRAGVLKLGHLKMIHGFHNGMFAARQAAMIYGSVVMGHGHSIDQYSIPGLEPRVGFMIGCACRLSMDYNRAHANTLRQAHGFAYGLLFPNGEYQLWQARRIGGKWIFPSEFKECA